MVPQTIAHYRLVEVIGEGGMGTVYRAEHLVLGTTVAIKALRHAGRPCGAERARLLHEARALAAIDHPNIVTLLDAFEDVDGLFLVMQYAPGRTLRAVLDAGPLDVREAVRVTIEIAEGLQAVHAHGVVHRDLKPENVMVAADGRCKLLDFGIAHLIEETTISHEGEVLGTLCYMAPEQLRGQPVDHRADLYALGSMLFELLCGKPPALVRPHPLEFAAPPLAPIAPHVTPELGAIVTRLLAVDPGHRYPDAASLLHDLRIVVRRLSPPQSAPDALLHVERRFRLARRIRWAGAALAALAALAVVLIVRRETGPPASARLLVAPFENTRDDAGLEWLSTGLMDGIISTLGGLEGCQVVSRTTVMSALRALPAAAGVSPLGLSSAARQVGVSHLVTGSFAQRASILRVQCQVHDLARGIIVASTVHEVHDLDAELFPCVDALAGSVAAALGARERRDGTGAPAAHGTDTRSARALRHYEEAVRAHGSQDFAAMVVSLQECVADDSTYVRAYLLLAEVHPEAKARRRALTTAMEYRLSAPQPQRDLVEAAWYRTDGDLDQAAQRYEQVLARFPEEVDARAALGTIEIERRRWPLAIGELEGLLERNPFDMACVPMLSFCYVQVGQPEKALSLCARWCARFPDQPRPLAWHIQMRTMLGDYERALAQCDTLARLSPAQHLLSRAPVLRYLGRMREAEQALTDAASVPGNTFNPARARVLLAYLYHACGQPQRGRLLTDQALQLQDDWYNRWVAGVIAVAAGDLTAGRRHARALTELLESSAADTLGPDPLTRKAYLYDLRGDLANAAHDLSEAVRLHRRALDCVTAVEEPTLRVELGEILLAAGDPPGAVAEASRALQINPRHPEALLLLGRGRLAAGDRQGARPPLAQLQSLWRGADADYARNVQLGGLMQQVR